MVEREEFWGGVRVCSEKAEEEEKEGLEGGVEGGDVLEQETGGQRGYEGGGG